MLKKEINSTACRNTTKNYQQKCEEKDYEMHENIAKGPNLTGEHILEHGLSIYPVTVAIFKILELNIKMLRSNDKLKNI